MDWAKETLQKPMWKEEIKNREAKEQVTKKMAERVQEGDIIGFGSGSTSYLTAIEIAKKVQTELLFLRHTKLKCYVLILEYQQQHWKKKSLTGALMELMRLTMTTG